MQIIIQPDGDARCVYDETIFVAAIGKVVISRGSHVEPNAEGEWHADLSPVGGPQLGPYSRRSAALAAERDWLEQHWLTTNPAST